MIQLIQRDLSPWEIANGSMKGIIPSEVSDPEGGFFFTATDEDPQIFLPQIPLEPVGGVLNLEITVPCEVMVQIFYQTVDSAEFLETHSLSVSLPSGKHKVERILDRPLNGFFRIDPGNQPGDYAIHSFRVSQQFRRLSLMPKSVSNEFLHSNQLRDLNFDDNGLHMKAMGRDPYFLLPKIELEPGPTALKLEATLQREAMVQVYFQTNEKKFFTEEQSVAVSSPAGRHAFRWVLNHSLNGFFRLDPGNMPWEYTIHRIEALQSVYIKEFKPDQIFIGGTQSREVSGIELTEDGVFFEATGDDPCIILPRMEFLPKCIKVQLDITLPCEALVQLYFQNKDIDVFSEQLSLKKSLPAGRHTIDWSLRDGSNGYLRLDPGNQPGRYGIHRIKIEQ